MSRLWDIVKHRLVQYKKDPVTGGITYQTVGGEPVGRALGMPLATVRKAAGTRYSNAITALSAAATRRVDFVMLGDSNQLYGGYGFTQGLEKRLASLFGAYATPIIWAGGAYSGSGVGYLCSGIDNSGLVLSDGADAGVLKYVLDSGYGHIASGTTRSASGIGLTGTHSLGNHNALTAYFAHFAASAYTGGSFKPTSRYGESPYSEFTTTATLQSTTGAPSHFAITSLDLSADAARTGKSLEFGFAVGGSEVVATGPITALWTRAENKAKTAGISCHTLYAQGGSSAWDMANTIVNYTDSQLETFFSEVRRLQISAGYSPVVVVYINSGLNDRNETNAPSLGPAKSIQPTSADAFVDNIRAIQARIVALWDARKWDSGELYWLLCPSHRISDPDDTSLVAYRAALVSMMGQDMQTTIVDLGSRMTYAAANTASWYDPGQSQVHLTTLGYDEIAKLILQGVA